MVKKTQKNILYDHLGREISIGDAVAFFHRGWSMMRTGRVVRITKVNVTISWQMNDGDHSRSILARDVIILDENAYVYHCLRKDIA